MFANLLLCKLKIKHKIVVIGVKSVGNPNARDLPARIKTLVNRVFIFYLDIVSDDNTVNIFLFIIPNGNFTKSNNIVHIDVRPKPIRLDRNGIILACLLAKM